MTEYIYDESKVPTYELPDPLITDKGHPVTKRKSWFEHRRLEIMTLFKHYVYGKSPERPADLTFQITEEEEADFLNDAIRRQVSIYLSSNEQGPVIHVLMYIPHHASFQPVPAFLALNFHGNHTINPDPHIHLVPQWRQNQETGEVIRYQPQEMDRGSSSRRWALHDIIDRGYGLITAYYGDIDPDYFDGFQNGVHSLYQRDDRGGNDWGSISAWAWGLSCIMDYLETDPTIDNTRVMVMGHSRLGKTALWAGAQDTRFAVVISNNSGCGGAALSRRKFGETIEAINTQFPHWFCTNFTAYNGNENALPVDQHELIALIAPRPVYIASAVEDKWADPLGEFLSGKSAHPVYTLLGTEGLPALNHPPLNQPIMGQIGYHIRPGAHDVTPYDWEQFMNFADMHLR